MKFYDNYWEDSYDELITYYPRFYRGVLEMEAILRAHGGVADGVMDSIERAYLNSFIDYMDEDTITRLEQFLHISLNKERTLEERRRLVKSFFVGFGKVSASMLAEMIQSYTGAAVSCRLEPFDLERNNMLYIDFERGESNPLYMSDIDLLLGKKIPAHIQWRAAVVYRFPVVVTNAGRRKYYRYGYDLCGTKPEISLHGDINSAATVIEAKRKNQTAGYRQASEVQELAGIAPEMSTLAAIMGAGSVVNSKAENYITEHQKAAETAQESGNWPGASLIGDTGKIDAAAEVKATGYGVDYIFCGETYSQS